MIRRIARPTAALLVAAVAACTTTLETTVVVTPTSVAIDPNAFLGNVPCSSAPGAAKAYVATIYDVNDPSTKVAVSDPMSCLLPVAFQQVQEIHSYFATIDVFDVPPAQVGGASPAWTTSCASPSGPNGTNGAATVMNQTRVFIEGCQPLDAMGTGKTSIVIDTAGLVGPIGCAGTMNGSITSLDVTPTSPAGTTLPKVIVQCGQSTVTYDAGVTPGTAYSFAVKAFAGASTPAAYATTCTVTARAGVQAQAGCAALTSEGSLAIDENALLAAGGFTCGGMSATSAASTYDVTFDATSATPITGIGVPCDVSAVLGPFSGGQHGGEVTIRNASGARIGHAVCLGMVTPGDVTTAACTPD